MPRSSTPSPSVNRIFSGLFQRELGYHVYRPGGTDNWLLIYTIRGSGYFGFGSEGFGKQVGRIKSAPGDVILLRPGTLHDYGVASTAKRWDLLWAHFHPRAEVQAWLGWPAVDSDYPGLLRMTTPDLAVRRHISQALRRMNQFAAGANREHFALNALEEALLWCSTQIPVASSSNVDPRIIQAEEYLCQHLRENVSLDQLADTVGLSVSRLSHLFRRQTGLTPQRYFERHRLERARDLLEMTSMPVKQIAVEVGFANPFYFTLRFKRYTGKSPRSYRRREN